METFIFLIKTSAFILTGFYFLLILIYSISWNRIKIFFSSPNENKTFVSIVVAARNEERNILQCLQHLSRQNYPVQLFEIIIANDFSEDNTKQIAESFIRSNQKSTVKLINLSEISDIKKGSKKDAIAEAVKHAKGELIVTTDADCTMNAGWLKTIAEYYELHQPYMISAPVCFSENNLFDKIQSLEFMSLIGSGAAAIKTGYPLMCNAANLAFKKEIFFETGRDNLKNEPFSGDDTFLMFAINNKYKGKISFLKSTDAMVTTQCQPSIKDFFNQRIRWTSKVKNYSNHYVQLVGVMLFLFNAMIFFTGVASLFTKEFFNLFLMQISAKMIIDFIFLFQLTGFFQKRKLLLLFIPVEFLHVFYILAVSLLSLSKKYKWKERVIKA
jgi:cellulose synthase/poly-beta-1,6-N-acetylglucosamine synthase-like glycosyltransferase